MFDLFNKFFCETAPFITDFLATFPIQPKSQAIHPSSNVTLLHPFITTNNSNHHAHSVLGAIRIKFQHKNRRHCVRVCDYFLRERARSLNYFSYLVAIHRMSTIKCILPMCVCMETIYTSNKTLRGWFMCMRWFVLLLLLHSLIQATITPRRRQQQVMGFVAARDY